HHDSNHGDSESSNSSSPFGSLPSKETVASRGLEAKVDMATHGHKSWGLMSLGAWRDQSLSSSDGSKSSAFIKSRQREARRAMLGVTGDAATAAAAAAITDAPMEERRAGADGWAAGPVRAKPPGKEEEGPSDMAVG
ncbi:unnamed protein product, partial [Pylaiella littoralis]